jgi:hypothetical protein
LLSAVTSLIDAVPAVAGLLQTMKVPGTVSALV